MSRPTMGRRPARLPRSIRLHYEEGEWTAETTGVDCVATAPTQEEAIRRLHALVRRRLDEAAAHEKDVP